MAGLRDAATTLLVRDGVTSLEVFMLRRSADAAFAPGAYVFPGGTLTEEDRAPDLESVCAGRTDSQASALLGVPSGGLAFWIAAIRECFEEAGVLLARDPGGGRSIEFTDAEVERRFIRHRHALQAGKRRFLDIVREERLLLDTGNVHYFSHWITPESLERRYDTRFFVAAAPPGQRALHDAQETVAGLWVRPADALERYHQGTFDLVIATLKHLEAMTRYDRAADLLDAARTATSVPTILPRIVRQGDRARSLLPGEPSYDEVNLIRLSPLVRRITAPNPSIMTGAGTNTYLVGIEEVAVIDPGPDDPQHIAALIQAVEGARVRWVLLTHTHRDHAPGARPLARRTGAQILAFSRSHRHTGHPPVTPDRTIGDGDVLATSGFMLEILHTPGHASDHLCFFLRDEAALFAGDLIMSGSTVVISPPDGDMVAYLRSLERLRQRRIARIYPGHGEVIEHPRTIIEEYILHRRMREAQVLDALMAGPLRIADLVVRIYAGLPEALHPLAARSVYAHLLKLKSEGKVAGGDRESEWTLV